MNMAKKKRRYISMLVFFTFLLNFCVPCLPMQAEATKNNITEGSLAESGSFSDIAGHWAEKEIKAWTARELAGGYPDGSFRPDSPITRAEFVTLVNRAFGYTEMVGMAGGQGNIPATYRDVAATDWFAGEIANGAAVGYLGGYPDGTVKPQNPLTRQEAAAIFARILPTNNNVLTDNNSNNSNNGNMDNTLAQFTDQAQIPEWSQAAIAAAVSGGYMNGYPDGSFQPAKPITRAEALSVLDRAVGTLYNRAGTYGPFQGTVVLEGNVTINTPGVTCKTRPLPATSTSPKGSGRETLL
ncbi:MAG: S-layer homology domain-containing protein [Peptococcia bacterium]